MKYFQQMRCMCSNSSLSDREAPAKFAFVGAGQMAEVMIDAMLATPILGHLPSISFFDVSSKVSDRVERTYQAAYRANDLAECVKEANVVVLCTKAQNCDTVFADLKPLLADEDPVLLSIIAGVTINAYVSGIGRTKVVRSMPNTPGQIRQGMTVWTKNTAADFSEEEIFLCKASLRVRLCCSSTLRLTPFCSAVDLGSSRV